MSRYIFHQTRLLKAPSSLALNTAREGAAAASLGNLGQCFTTLIVKNFLLRSSINLPSFSLKLLPLVLSLQALVKNPSLAFLQAPSGTGKLLQGQLGAFSSSGWTAPTPSACPRRRGAPALWSSSWPSSGPALTTHPCPSYVRGFRAGRSTPGILLMRVADLLYFRKFSLKMPPNTYLHLNRMFKTS